MIVPVVLFSYWALIVLTVDHVLIDITPLVVGVNPEMVNICEDAEQEIVSLVVNPVQVPVAVVDRDTVGTAAVGMAIAT